jgi:hypothetical protein
MADRESVEQRLTTLSTVLRRAALASSLGQQYGGMRNIYDALGYQKELSYSDFVAQYSRQDIARAVVDRPVDATWRGGVSLVETDEDEDTALERDWSDIYRRLRLQSKLTRLDRLTCLGRFGVLLLGLSDVQRQEDFASPVRDNDLDLMYVKPFGEGSVAIDRWVDDPGDERFGLPELYQLDVKAPGTKSNVSLVVHHSRVIHATSGLLESEVYGTPQMQGVFNRLKDLEKIVGGAAEMFWRGARPGYQAKVDENYSMGPDMEDKLQEQLEEFEHDLRRVLANEGVTFESLQQQVSDPSSHVDVQIQMISAEKGIPKRILVGSERGELASSDDKSQWNERVQSRREEHAEPSILDPLVERLVEYGCLATPKEQGNYSWYWSDLHAPSEKERAEIGKTRAEALAAYAKTPRSEEVVPQGQFYRHFLGLSEEQVEGIEAASEQEVEDEESEIEADRETGSPDGGGQSPPTEGGAQ